MRGAAGGAGCWGARRELNRANLTKSDNRHESTTGISISKYNRKKKSKKKIEEKKSRGDGDGTE